MQRYETKAIFRPGRSLNVFSASINPLSCLLKTPFPKRQVQRRKTLVDVSVTELEQCIQQLGVHLGPLIPNQEERVKVLRLLYQYQHLNSLDMTDLLVIDLIIHGVKLASGVKPYSVSQRRWPPHMEWWLRKLV